MPPKGREQKRLEKELLEMREKNSLEGATLVADSVGDSLHKWRGKIKGPDDTPYAGGEYTIDIDIPENYPYDPPKMKFATKIWHPNVSSQTGAICLDVLGKEWSPALSIRTALLSIQALLNAPEPDDPQDAEVANMFKANPEQFKQTAMFWCQTYAQGGNKELENKIKQMQEMGMGWSDKQCEDALTIVDMDVARAVDALLGGM